MCHLGILLKSGFWVSASGLKLEALHYHKLQVMLLLLLLHHVGRHLTKELQDPFYLRSQFAFRGTSFLMILLVGCSVPIANRIILGFILKVKNQYLTRDGMDKNRKGNFGLCVGNWMPLWEGKYGKTKHLWLKVMILFFFNFMLFFWKLFFHYMKNGSCFFHMLYPNLYFEDAKEANSFWHEQRQSSFFL